MRDVASLAELKALAGTDVAVSDWFEVSQGRGDAFAGATDDHQWIHVDPARCDKPVCVAGLLVRRYP